MKKMLRLDLVSAQTGDVLLSYGVPEGICEEVVKEVEAIMRAAGCVRQREAGLLASSADPERGPKGNDCGRRRHYGTRKTLAYADLVILEYLWERNGEPIFKKDMARDLGRTFGKVEYSLRKKLKALDVVTVVPSYEEREGFGANYYVVDKENAVRRMAASVKGVSLDLSGYDLGNDAEVRRMFAAVRDVHEGWRALMDGEISIHGYLAEDAGLRGQVDVGKTASVLPGMTPSRVKALLERLQLDPSTPLGELDDAALEALVKLEHSVA